MAVKHFYFPSYRSNRYIQNNSVLHILYNTHGFEYITKYHTQILFTLQGSQISPIFLPKYHVFKHFIINTLLY